MNYFTSDLHFGHGGVIEYCARPFGSVPEMNEALVDKWNRVIRPSDTVYVLGDLSFMKPVEGVPLLGRLLGRKILIQGNHDEYSVTQYAAAGFDLVLQECVIKIGGHRVRLSHYPRLDEDEDDRYPHKRPPARDEWLVCGHVHTRWKTRGKMINVGVDVWGFSPVPQTVIESIIDKEQHVESR